MNNALRLILKKALQEGENRFEETTGFIHLSYLHKGNEKAFTIPTAENALYALSLIRTHKIEAVTKGFSLLEKLIAFQSQEGNFPLYLHEYPTCYKSFHVLQLLIPLYWVFKNYSSIIPKGLKETLWLSFIKGLTYCDKTSLERTIPYPLKVQLEALKKGVCDHFGVNIGESRLEKLCVQDPSWYSPRDLGQILLGLQIGYSSLRDSPWSPFLEHLHQNYHREWSCYTGKAYREFYFKDQMEITLLDMMMATLYDQVASRLETSTPFYFYAALIQPFSSQDIPVEQKLPTWVLKGYPDLLEEKGAYPLKITFSGEKLSSFCLERPKGKVEMEIQEYKVHLKVFPEEGFKGLSFYLNHSAAVQFLEGGQTASLFHPQRPFTLKCPTLQLQLCFQGPYRAHIMRSNRPSQLENKLEEPFDWLLYLRPLKLEPLSIELEVLN